MAYEVLPFEILNIQINVLIIQRTTCLHLQRSMLSKPGTPSSSPSNSTQPKPYPSEKPQIQNYEKISYQQPQNRCNPAVAEATYPNPLNPIVSEATSPNPLNPIVSETTSPIPLHPTISESTSLIPLHPTITKTTSPIAGPKSTHPTAQPPQQNQTKGRRQNRRSLTNQDTDAIRKSIRPPQPPQPPPQSN